MKPKFIFFNTCGLGDYLIHSNIIKKLSKKYDIIAVCSEYNGKIISKQNFIKKIIYYNKDYSFFKKIKIFFNIIFNSYSLSMVFDLQYFSLFTNIFLFSANKRSLVMKTPRFFFKYKFFSYFPNRIYQQIFLNKFCVITRPKHLNKIEHIPSKYKRLFNEFMDIKKMKSFYSFNDMKLFENEKQYLLNKYKIKKFIFINFDDKWNDIKNIDKDLFSVINKLSNNKIHIIISSYKYNQKFFLNMVKNFTNFHIKLLKIKNSKIFYLKNPNVFLIERFVASSSCVISCHSGIAVHSAAANKIPILDIVSYKRSIYLKSWMPNSNYYQIFKEKLNSKKFLINDIFDKIETIVKKVY